MPLPLTVPAAIPTAAPRTALEGVKPRFAQALQQTQRTELAPQVVSPGRSAPHRAAGLGAGATGCRDAPAGRPAALHSPPVGPQAAAWVERVAGAQRRLDAVLKLAQSGKTFRPAELIAFQAQVYRASQELDLVGKVVEKGTGGVKQVLQTQV